MTDQPHTHASAKPAPAAPKAETSLLRTVVNLWPYVWPKDRRDLHVRAVGALALLFIAKFVTIAVPFSFKWATDALTEKGADNPEVMTVLAGQWRSPSFTASCAL